MQQNQATLNGTHVERLLMCRVQTDAHPWPGVAGIYYTTNKGIRSQDARRPHPPGQFLSMAGTMDILVDVISHEGEI